MNDVRSVLMAIMLLVAIIVLYEATIGGEEGAWKLVEDRGSRIHLEIGGIDP